MKKNLILLSTCVLWSMNVLMASPNAPKAPEAPAAPVVVNQQPAPAVSLIKGCVMSHDKELLAGALVEVNGKKVYTDFDGRFAIEATDGSKAEVTMISYMKSHIVISAHKGNDVTIILQQQ